MQFPPGVETVQWRRGWGYRGGWGWGDVGAGFVAGAVIGGALASPYYGYDPYCMQRFKSYDPRSGTYLGYDGARHPCP
jgi:hypothetical protein